MNTMTMFLVLLVLILLNGIFAMAEIAIITARKSRLKQLAEKGDTNAQSALELAGGATRFLSTIQIGITAIGVFAGAFGEATMTIPLAKTLSIIPLIHPYTDAVAFVIVVLTITYLSLVLGELVPKRIALTNPEKIATLVAAPMRQLSLLLDPVVTILSRSTEWILHLLSVKPRSDLPVSEEEIRLLIREGARAGVFEVAEQDIVERTLSLGDRKVQTIMTPKSEIDWIDVKSSEQVLKKLLAERPHSYYPVAEKNREKILGVIHTDDLLTHYLHAKTTNLHKIMRKPLYIPETLPVLSVLEQFKKTGIHMGLIVDEYGNLQGLVTLSNILEALVGDIPTIDEIEDSTITKRDKNSWLIDGLVAIDEFKKRFEIPFLPGEKAGNYHTVGGFVMYLLGTVPKPGERKRWNEYRFEVVDMDGNRIDKVLVSKHEK